MTQEVKEQIVELFATLKEAHGEMRIYLEQQDYINVNTILADCQDCALLIGNTVEQFEDDQEKIIRELEEYYEELYWVNSNLEEGGRINAGVTTGGSFLSELLPPKLSQKHSTCLRLRKDAECGRLIAEQDKCCKRKQRKTAKQVVQGFGVDTDSQLICDKGANTYADIKDGDIHSGNTIAQYAGICVEKHRNASSTG